MFLVSHLGPLGPCHCRVSEPKTHRRTHAHTHTHTHTRCPEEWITERAKMEATRTIHGDRRHLRSPVVHSPWGSCPSCSRPQRLTRMNHTHALTCSTASSWVQPVEPWLQITGREEKEARCLLLWPSPWSASSDARVLPPKSSAPLVRASALGLPS